MTTKEDVIKNSPYKPIEKEIVSYTRETHDAFTIKLDWALDHEPGQFVFCSLPGIGEAPISICSYSDKYVELNIREVGNMTNKMALLKKGDKLLVRGAYGRSYPMDKFKGNNVVIVGGGSGVAPLKGIVEYINANRSDYKGVQLFFGFRTPDDILFKKEIKGWRNEFDVNLSFDKVEKPTKEGVQGFVTQLVEDKVNGNDQKIIFICGPPIMIEKVAEILLKKGFNEDQIYISAERLMYCGMGKCGRCMIHGKYTCLDGAVFRFDELKEYKDD